MSRSFSKELPFHIKNTLFIQPVNYVSAAPQLALISLINISELHRHAVSSVLLLLFRMQTQIFFFFFIGQGDVMQTSYRGSSRSNR